MRPMFQGSIVALVTPFRNGAVDETKLRDLVDFHATNGTDGTTGESPTLGHDEHKRVVEIVVEAAHGRLPIIAGTGSNSTVEAIDLTRHAKRAGATATDTPASFDAIQRMPGHWQRWATGRRSASIAHSYCTK